MTVIIEGEERIVNTIVRENRVRVSRGLVKFSPADSISTPEGVTEEDVKNMVEAIGQRDARIAELMDENETLKAALAEKEDTKDAPEIPDTKAGGESDTTDAPQGDSKDAPLEDSKETVEASDTKGKEISKK